MASPLKTGYNPFDAIFDTFRGVIDIVTMQPPDSTVKIDTVTPIKPIIKPSMEPTSAVKTEIYSTPSRRIKFRDVKEDDIKQTPRRGSVNENSMKPTLSDQSTIVKSSILKVRSLNGSDFWEEFSVTLNKNSEIIVVSKNGNTPTKYVISPSCSAFETNLSENSFEVVTPKQILHLATTSKDITSSWIESIREIITKSPLDKKDILLRAALHKSKDDVFYEVEFRENRPLGIVLERSGEWAVVKKATIDGSGVRVGSVLTSINGDSVIVNSYQSTISRLRNWTPPLRLGNPPNHTDPTELTLT